jgi:hypothetical protein
MCERAGFTTTVASAALYLTVGLVLAAGVEASFEIDPVSPAERGAATHLALGRAEGSFGPPCRADHGAAGSGSVRVYGFKPFGVEEIDFCAIWASVLLGDKTHSLCLSYQRLRALSYLEETYLVSHGFRVGRLWCLPAVRFGTVTFDGRRLDWMALVDVALSIDVGDGRDIFVGLKNPFVSGLTKSGGACPASATIGFGCPISKRLGWGIEVGKQGGHPTALAAGVEWSLAGGLLIRAGLRTYPREFCLGVGLRLGQGAVDVATSVIPDLGATHEIGASCEWD